MCLTVTETRKGHIHRIVTVLGMGYIAEPETDQLWPFLFSQLKGYAGQDPDEIGLVAQAQVTFTLRDGALVGVNAENSGNSMAQTGAN